MRDIHFTPPLAIETAELGKIQVLSNVQQAAVFLLQHWPGSRGAKFKAATQACLDVLEGKSDAPTAREAVIAAADADDIFTRDG